jgi:Tfp pilus assembly protein PilO
MKIRNLLIIILIVVLVVVYSLVVTDYLKQRNQKATLESQVAEATASLALIPNPPADLEEQLTAAQKGFESAKDAFAINTNDTRIVNRILEIAKENGVKAIPLATQPWVLESVLDQSYSVFRLDIAATGSYPQLVSFLNQLENSEPKTLVIEYLTVDAAPGSSLLDSAARNAQLLNADIKLAIYAPPITTSL